MVHCWKLLGLTILFAIVTLVFIIANTSAKEEQWQTDLNDWVNEVDVTHDGELIAAGSNDDNIYLFDSKTGEVLWNHTTGDDVLSVDISDNGSHIVGASSDNNFYLLPRESNIPLWNYTCSDIARTVAISGNGEYIAAGSYDNHVYLFDRNSSIPLWSFDTAYNVLSVAITESGDYLVAGSQRGLYVFQRDNSTPIMEYDSFASFRSVAISSNGEYIVGGSSDDKVYLFDKDSSTPLWTYTTDDRVLGVDMTPDGEYLVAGSRDDSVYYFKRTSSNPLWSYETDGAVQSVSISDHFIAAGSSDRKAYLFTTEGDEPLWEYQTGQTVSTVDISADGQYVTYGSGDNNIYYFTTNDKPAVVDFNLSITATNRTLETGIFLNGSDSEDDESDLTPIIEYLSPSSHRPKWNFTADSVVSATAISGDGSVIAVGSWDQRLYLFNKESSTPIWSYETGSRVWNIAMSKDGQYITVGSADKNVYLFHVSNSTPIWISDVGWPVTSVAISDNGEYIIAGAGELETFGEVRLYHRENSSMIWNFTTNASIRDVDISADGKRIVAGCWNNRSFTFSSDSPIPKWNSSHELSVRAVAISADGNFIAIKTSSYLYLYSYENSTPLWRSYELSLSGFEVDLSHDGEYIVTGGKVSLYHRSSPVPVWNYGFHLGQLYSVDIAADAQYIAASDSNGKLYYLSTELGKPLWILDTGTNKRCYSISISDDGRQVIGGSENDNAYFFYNDWNSSYVDDFLFSNNTWSATFTPPKDAELGNYSFRTNFKDTLNTEGKWSHLSYQLNVSQLKPMAFINVGNVLSFNESEEILLTGHGISEANILEYRWVSNVDGLLSTMESFSISNLTNGTHNIDFRIYDGNQYWSESANISVRINGRPRIEFEELENHLLPENTTVQLVSNAYDDNGILRYHWESSIDGFLSLERTYNSSNFSYGNHTITLRVQDDEGLWSSNESRSLIINAIPEAEILDLTFIEATEGENGTINGRGQDLNGVITDHQWLSSLHQNVLGRNSSLQISLLVPGNHTIFFSVQDDLGHWSENVSMIVFINSRPTSEISNTSSRFIHSTDFAVLEGYGHDVDGFTVEYLWVSDIDGVLGAQSKINISDLSSGFHIISFFVKDDFGAWSNPIEAILEVNNRPTISAVILQHVVIHPTSATFILNSTDTDGNVTEYIFRFSNIINAHDYRIISNSSMVTIDSTEMISGNYSLDIISVDNRNGTSSPLRTWFYVNEIPMAFIESIKKHEPNDGKDHLDLQGSFKDDGTIKEVQWRSDKDGIIGAELKVSIHNLSIGEHSISLRVMDQWGYWSNWTYADESIKINEHQKEKLPFLLILLSLIVLIAGFLLWVQNKEIFFSTGSSTDESSKDIVKGHKDLNEDNDEWKRSQLESSVDDNNRSEIILGQESGNIQEISLEGDGSISCRNCGNIEDNPSIQDFQFSCPACRTNFNLQE